MKYKDYTPPENIRPNTCKYFVRMAWEKRGERAAYKANAKFKKPVKDTTLATWFCHWRWLEEQRA